MRTKCRAGFTIIELLVAIAIIGVLVALLMPAIQAARESARRAQCSNQLRQLALAMQNYHAAHRTLPSGSYCIAGSAHCGSLYGCHNWFTSLLPFTEESALAARLNTKRRTYQEPNMSTILGRVLPSLKCPSDPAEALQGHHRFADSGCPPGVIIAGPFSRAIRSMGMWYVPSGGPVAPGGSGTCMVPKSESLNNLNCVSRNQGYAGNGAPGMFSSGWIGYNFKQCTDGLSKTLLIGEALPDYQKDFMLFNSHYIVATTNLPPNQIFATNCQPQPTDWVLNSCHFWALGYNSHHPGGVNVAMADGSAHFIAETVDYHVWVYLGHRADGQPVVVP
jgi:prepilin-type N-terminal cleavage/methylation domain-containing protein/prepilin-type processing-associated H-X9-DG protein